MLQAMNTGHDGSLSTVHANSPRDALSRARDDGADGRLRAAAPRDPPAGLVGARPDRPARPARRRHAPRDGDHRGAADGGRDDHAPEPVRVPRRPRGGGPHGGRAAGADGPPPDVPGEVRAARDRAPADLFGTLARCSAPARTAPTRASRRVEPGSEDTRLATLPRCVAVVSPSRRRSAAPRQLELTPVGRLPFPERGYVVDLRGRAVGATRRQSRVTENGRPGRRASTSRRSPRPGSASASSSRSTRARA